MTTIRVAFPILGAIRVQLEWNRVDIISAIIIRLFYTRESNTLTKNTYRMKCSTAERDKAIILTLLGFESWNRGNSNQSFWV